MGVMLGWRGLAGAVWRFYQQSNQQSTRQLHQLRWARIQGRYREGVAHLVRHKKVLLCLAAQIAARTHGLLIRHQARAERA